MFAWRPIDCVATHTSDHSNMRDHTDTYVVGAGVIGVDGADVSVTSLASADRSTKPGSTKPI
jgi:hypothetical protein